jgi:PAS domain S-box-containing protein
VAEDLLEVLGNTQDGVFVVDGRQRILVWNKAAQQILGYQASEVLGRPCYEVIAGDLMGKGHECKQDCNVMLVSRQGAVPPTQTSAVRAKDGTEKWLNITHIAVPLGPPRNETALIHVFRDVTQEQAARRLVDDLVQYLRSGVRGKAAGAPAQAPRPAAEPGPLTPREIQVLQFMAEGCGTAEIADRLVISVSTARNHIQNMLEKLGVHSRMEAVMYGINHGLIALPERPSA